MYELIVTNKAQKSIENLDSFMKKRILDAIMSLVENPYLSIHVKKMKGLDNTYRKRVGNYRIIYRISDGELTVFILSVGSRGDIYKK